MAFDQDLRTKLLTGSAKFSSIRECDSGQAERVVTAMKTRFNIKSLSPMWGDSIGVPFELHSYGDADSSVLLSSSLPEPGASAYLIVSDGREPPWPIFQGRADELLRLVSSVDQFFEHGLVDETYAWLVYDNFYDSQLYTVNIKVRPWS